MKIFQGASKFLRFRKRGEIEDLSLILEDLESKQVWEDNLLVIGDYGGLMEHCYPTQDRIQDVSALPHSKDRILYALLLEVIRGDLPMVDELYVAATSLAYYQEGIGPEPIRMLDLGNVPSFKDREGWLVLAERLADSDAEANTAKFEKFNALAQGEITQIKAQIEQAMQLGKKLREVQNESASA
jgi:hypothetical protein